MLTSSTSKEALDDETLVGGSLTRPPTDSFPDRSRHPYEKIDDDQERQIESAFSDAESLR